MTIRQYVLFAVAIASLGLAGWLGYERQSNATLPLHTIKLPPGFSIALYATGVDNARSMALGPNGTVFVGSMDAGNVYSVTDRNKDNRADEVIRIASGLNMPNGVAFRDRSLYIAELNRVLRYDDIEAHLKSPPKPSVIYDSLPKDTHHGWKFIAFGPDGMLYVPVGAPCNICEDREPYAAIHRMKPDGSGFEVFARGVRNTVGFDWHPATKELWFTDNGRDNLGDNVPPDELNRAPQAGMNFGYPKCHGTKIIDPQFGRPGDCERNTPPAIELGPHVAAIGMRFYTGSIFPREYENQIIIAEHGSWNRSVPIGYRVSVVRMEGNKATKYETLAEGWLQGSNAWGRPVDVLVVPDGSVLVSDDKAGAIYRITYSRGL